MVTIYLYLKGVVLSHYFLLIWFYWGNFGCLNGSYAFVRRRSLNCSVRFSGGHFIDWIPDKKRLKCAVCCGKSGNFAGSGVKTWCPDCGVGLCVGQCFRDFHTLVMCEEWWQLINCTSFIILSSFFLPFPYVWRTSVWLISDFCFLILPF